MKNNKPRHKTKDSQPIEEKTLVTVTLEFDLEQVFNSEMSPDEFGKMVCRHVYKTLPYGEKSHYKIDEDLQKEFYGK